MVALELADVEVDYCLACRGVWLDRGELEHLTGGTPAGAALCGSLRDAPASGEAVRPCPICRKSMGKVLCGTGTPALRLDRCGGGHGLWFDRDELQAAVQLGAPADDRVLGLLNDIFGSKPQPS
jgi:hypothetical protein